MRVRKRPLEVEASRWFKDGDHPEVDHGWIVTLEGSLRVTPGDWIITGVNGEVYPCKDDIFRKSYQEWEPAVQGGDWIDIRQEAKPETAIVRDICRYQ